MNSLNRKPTVGKIFVLSSLWQVCLGQRDAIGVATSVSPERGHCLSVSLVESIILRSSVDPSGGVAVVNRTGTLGEVLRRSTAFDCKHLGDDAVGDAIG